MGQPGARPDPDAGACRGGHIAHSSDPEPSARSRPSNQASPHGRVDNSDSPRFEDPRRMRGLRARGRSSASRVRTARRTHRSGGIPLMSTGSDLIAMIASRQNLADYQKKHWDGTFAEYLDIVRDDPEVTRTAYQRLYDMILVTAPRRSSTTRRSTSATSSSTIPTTTARTPSSASSGPLMQPGQRLQERRATATASSGACCCCTARSAAARARSPGC